MSSTDTIASSVQTSRSWIRDVEAGLGVEDEHLALMAFRVTLHVLRDRLQTDLIAHLGAQLPTLLRGFFYEGWDPSPLAERQDTRLGFRDAVREELKGHPRLGDVDHTVQAVFSALAAHVTPGEIEKVSRALPGDIRNLWPEGNGKSPSGRH